jgi:hypothetical protein
VKNSNQKPPSTLLTYDGELSLAVAELQQQKHSERLQIAVKLLGSLLVVLLLVLIGLVLANANEDVFGAIFAIATIAGLFGFQSFSYVKWIYKDITFPFGEVARRSIKKQSMKKKGWNVSTQPSETIESGEELFLLYEQHSAFLEGKSHYIRKYAFQREMRFVYSIVVPVFGLVTLVLGGGIVLGSSFLGGFLAVVPTDLIFRATGPDERLGVFVWLWGVPFLCSFFTTGIIYTAINSDLRFRYLRRYGQIVPGEIIGDEAERGTRGKRMIVLKYCFTTPDDRVISTKLTVPSELVRYRDLPKPGDSVAVLYADDTCYKLL